jgi:hypothetical protein
VYQLWQDLSEEVKADFTVTYPQIKWTFSTPLAPHRNGVCERMVQTVKRALKAIIQPGLLTERDFETFLVQAEGIINSRPLGHVSTDANDLKALTPNDFIRGRIMGDLKPHEAVDWSLSKKLQHVEELQNHFWRRYVTEMTPNFHVMNEWTKKRRDFKVGDVVATTDKKVRGRWPLGKIVAVKPGSDGVVRTVTVRQKEGEYDRHVGQLLQLVAS